MALILWLATFNQMIPNDNQSWQARAGYDKSIGDRARDDLAFERAVEESVMAEPGTAPPEPYKGLMDRLGMLDYSCREGASRRLLVALKATPGDARWLMWGRRHPDLEVRLRANALLRRLHPCPTCKGFGILHDKWDGGAIQCWDCGGTQSAWPWSIWD